MNKIKKIITSIAMLLLIIPLTITQLRGDDSDYFDEDDDLDFSLNDAVSTEPSLRSSGNPNAYALAPIATTLQTYNIFKQPQSLWNKTWPPRSRNVLYLFQNDDIQKQGYSFSASLFANITNRMPASANSHINFDNINTEELNNLVVVQGTGIESLPEINALFSSFRTMTIQEHKAGFFIQSNYLHKALSFQLQTSLQLNERNFWLDSQNQAALAALMQSAPISALNNLFFTGDTPELDVSEFYRIKTGLGDTRINLGCNVITTATANFDVGLSCIIPTSRLTTRRQFSTTSNQLLLNPEEIAGATFSTLFNVRDYLLYPDLGDGGHFSVGFYTDHRLTLPKQFGTLKLHASYDKPLPSTENRLVMHNLSMTASDLETDASEADLVISSMNEFIDEYLLPDTLKVTVNPGGIFNATASITTPIKRLNSTYTFGYNFYAQQQEQFTDIPMSNLRLHDATYPTAYQHQLFSELLYSKEKKSCSLQLGIGGNIAFASHNLGNNWTAYVRAGASF